MLSLLYPHIKKQERDSRVDSSIETKRAKFSSDFRDIRPDLAPTRFSYAPGPLFVYSGLHNSA